MIGKRRFRTDDFLANLTDRALHVILRQGVSASSVDVEVRLWRTLRRVFRAARRRTRSLARLLAALAAAAYRVALRHRPAGSFVDLELGLWHAFRAYRCRLAS